MMTHIPTTGETLKAGELAGRRHRDSIGKASRRTLKNNRRDSKTSDGEMDYRGALAEVLVWTRVLGRSLSALTEPDGQLWDGDIDFTSENGHVQIKSTRHRHGILFVRDRKITSDLYILVYVDDDYTIHLRGWTDQESFLTYGYEDDLGDRDKGMVWALPNCHLQPMKTFPK